VNAYGEENILIGFALYEDTAKGLAMGADTCFAKVIADSPSGRILGAHIAGPSASILIQEIVTLMRVKQDTTVFDIGEAMHIHPALSEVIEHACLSLMPVSHYHHILADHLGLEPGSGQMK
jgi:dihydrolipoamide dehydrogenase